ncbi:MAG TPA: zinc ribbon domain-containing protein [Gemmatimonadaceae bacterium]|nr:zinc ribbon domain-containing protein [Gemmatimonadaceae bacterium]
MTPLVIGTVLAVAALAYVLYPVFTAPRRAAPGAGPAPGPRSDAEIEALIGSYRTAHRDCPSCGARPESDALYCSECGRYLATTCRWCGAPVGEEDARFCGACGRELRAP